MTKHRKQRNELHSKSILPLTSLVDMMYDADVFLLSDLDPNLFLQSEFKEYVVSVGRNLGAHHSLTLYTYIIIELTKA